MVVRTSLTAAEAEQPLTITVELALRNLPELRRRVERGEILSRAEMLERYYPSPATHAAVAHWLTSQGFEVRRTDTPHLAVEARNRISGIAVTLDVRFARVRGADGEEVTSALSAPVLPAELAGNVVAIGGLQPHLRARPREVNGPMLVGGQVAPQVIRDTYRTGKLDGRGQEIAIMGGGVDPGDLDTFWTQCGVPQSSDRITVVNVGWTPTYATGIIDSFETTGDVEWAGAIAPAAKIRIYHTVDPRQFAAAVLDDLPAHPNLRQISLSFGLAEAANRPGIMRAESQYYVALAAEGVSIFASSGDGGSNDGSTTPGGFYDPDAPLSVLHPASDPCVTAVGGTLLEFNSTGTMIESESSYSGWVADGKLLPGSPASGGGLSATFQRPAWQTGPGVPAGTQRCVPDVSAVWTTTLADVYVVFRGQPGGFGGTSLSSPVWGGLCALLNQARSAAGLAPVGLLGPRIYPLLGTNAFNDVTVGTNGAYNAGAGYDLCSGVGTPNIENLAAALVRPDTVSVPVAPLITAQPGSQSVAPGTNLTLTVAATSESAITYQWMVLEPADQNWGEIDGAPWTNLSDDAVYSGTHTAALTIAAASAGLDRNMYQCQVANSYGITLTIPAIIRVDALQPAIKPVITRPPSFAWILAGRSASFTVAASGTGPLTYQWFDSNHVAIPGATAPTYRIESVRPADLGAHWIQVTGPGGTVEGGALLTVITNPTLTCPSTAAGVVGQPFAYTITAINYDQGANSDDFTSPFAATGLPPGLSLNRASGEISGVPTQKGVFDVIVSGSNVLGMDTMQLTLTITDAGPPQIITQPQRHDASARAYPLPFTYLQVTASGDNLTYQWKRDGQALVDGNDFSGVTTPSLGISTISPSYNGSYEVVVSNASGTVISDAVTITEDPAPLIVAQPPHRQILTAGASAWLSVAAEKWALGHHQTLTYQWQHDGVDIPGATENSLYLPQVGSDQAGTYTVVVNGPNGSVTSTDSVVEVHSDARVANISTRSWVGTGDDVQIAGFVISGTAPKQVLIRAAGPALGLLGVPDTLGNPRVRLHHIVGNDKPVIATNDDWCDGATPVDEIERAAQRTGAFTWDRDTRDAAILATLAPGAYTAIVEGADGGTGVALIEVYDADATPTTSQLVNISTRASVRAGAQVMIAGFVIGGAQPKTVLIRAAGPALTGLVSPPLLRNPRFVVHDALADNAELFGNDDWCFDAAMEARVQRTGATTSAFAWPVDSADAAMVTTLAPGIYTVVVSDPSGPAGSALVEVYEVP